jgi:hypothetical protein
MLNMMFIRIKTIYKYKDFFMKNKLFLSLALLIATNSFITTPAIAMSWSDAGKAALATAKAAIGLTAIAGSIALPIAAYKMLHQPDYTIDSIKLNTSGFFNANVSAQFNIGKEFLPTAMFPGRHRVATIPPFSPFSNKIVGNYTVQALELIPAIYTLVGAASVGSFIYGCTTLKSALDDFKKINKNINKNITKSLSENSRTRSW